MAHLEKKKESGITGQEKNQIAEIKAIRMCWSCGNIISVIAKSDIFVTVQWRFVCPKSSMLPSFILSTHTISLSFVNFEHPRCTRSGSRRHKKSTTLTFTNYIDDTKHKKLLRMWWVTVTVQFWITVTTFNVVIVDSNYANWFSIPLVKWPPCAL